MKTKKRIVSTVFSAMIVMATCTSSFAQEEKTKSNKQVNKQTDNDAVLLKDGYMVKGEKVMLISNGKVTTLNKEVTFKNGDKLMTNAVLIKKDGEKKMLKNGDYIDMEGQMKTRQAMTKDCMMMKDGKMYVTKDGKTTVVEKDMTMKNGTVCSANGMCTTKDGKKIALKNGECMDMEGQMIDKEDRMMNK